MTDQFERIRVALADRYVVERKLGEGGMATVYLAQDVKHHRKVALKILLPELAAVLGAERFLNEIRVTANLHHPNIVQLYDSGEADGDLYYVMPYVEGESLRAKLERERQLSVEEAVSITRVVADALDYAHRRNVIHRDIKPDNIMLHEGTPMVTDFGIALAVSSVAGDRITGTGLSLGTPSYMSPEQATGDREAKPSLDVYALGSVLYEMLAGDPPFTGSNVQAVIAKVVGEKPVKLRVVRDMVPPAVEAAVDRALAKVPADRFATTKDFANALVLDVPVAPDLVATKAPRRWLRVLGVATLVAVIALGAWFVAGRKEGGTGTLGLSNGTIRQLTSFAGWEMSPSFSPDGSQIAYAHIVGGDADVAILSLGGGDPHLLTKDSPYDEINARWSPDGSKIAFLSDRGAGTNVYWIPPTGGTERLLAETHIPFLERMYTWAGALGPDPWSPDSKELLFSRMAPNGDVALWKLHLETGDQTQLTTPPAGGEDTWGSWSHGGEQIMFQRLDQGVPSVWLLPAAGGEPSLLLGDGLDYQPAWLPDDEHVAVMTLRGGALNIWQVDLRGSSFTPLTTGGAIHYTPVAAPNGSLAYVEFGHDVDLHWVPVDKPGVDERITFLSGENFAPRLSPDGRWVVWYRGPPYDLWLHDRTTGAERQLTDDPAANRSADWSPAGDEIVYLSNRDGAVRLWIVDVASGISRRLSDHSVGWSMLAGDTKPGPRWSPDGRVIAYLAPGSEGTIVWLIDPDGTNRRESTVRDASSFAWYKDSERMVYVRHAPDGSGHTELRAAHLSTGEDVLLTTGAFSEVAVSPDGSKLTYISSISHFTMQLLMRRLTATASQDELPSIVGEPEPLTAGNGEWHVHAGGWAWDGSGVVYSRDRDFGDIYLLEPAP